MTDPIRAVSEVDLKPVLDRAIYVESVDCHAPTAREIAMYTRIEFRCADMAGTIALRGGTPEEIQNVCRAFRAPGTRTKLLLLSDYIPICDEIADLKRR